MNSDERLRAVTLAIDEALLQCGEIMTRWRDGARFSIAAQHALCQAALRLHGALGLRLPPRGAADRVEPPAGASGAGYEGPR